MGVQNKLLKNVSVSVENGYESMTSLCLFKEIECLHVHFLLLIHKTLQHLKQPPFWKPAIWQNSDGTQE